MFILQAKAWPCLIRQEKRSSKLKCQNPGLPMFVLPAKTDKLCSSRRAKDSTLSKCESKASVASNAKLLELVPNNISAAAPVISVVRSFIAAGSLQGLPPQVHLPGWLFRPLRGLRSTRQDYAGRFYRPGEQRDKTI